MPSEMRRRRSHRARPMAEGLEMRALLNARFDYLSASGAHVTITLTGPGNLKGTSVRPDGSLDLVYAKTLQNTLIFGHVTGGRGGVMPLSSVRDASAAPGDFSGVGSEKVGVVNLAQFGLIGGGQINLTAGVSRLVLDSAEANSQIHVGAPPAISKTSTSTGSSPSTGVVGGTTGTTTTTTTGSTITSVTSSTGVAGGTSGTTTGGGTFFAGTQILIGHVRGSFAAGLGDPQVFGYDPTANALVRFDAKTGAALQTIPVPAAAPGTTVADVGLGRDAGRLVALVGIGPTIYAYDATTGAAAGSFSTASLAANGLTAVDGIGSTGTRTIVSDASAGALGLLQEINVTASLASGQAVPVGVAYSPLQQFQLGGALTGLAGSDAIYASGAAHFDNFDPGNTQLGVLVLNASSNTPSEAGRSALPNASSPGGANAPPGPLPSPGLGSVDQDLAQVTGLGAGGNVVTFFNSSNLSTDGFVTLAYPNLLTGLTESFRPSLDGSVLVDARGNVRTFQADDATGLVLNIAGEAQQVLINRATNSTIVARPLDHLGINVRTNVVAQSTPRVGKQSRGGVDVVFGLKPIGPLTLPDAGR